MNIVYEEDLLDTLLRLHKENPICSVELDYSDFRDVKEEAILRGRCDHSYYTYIVITDDEGNKLFDVKEED
tara:strand:- start:627 stop:839 length:213 start_codon:yes stop_codon:yes gene_type:complete